MHFSTLATLKDWPLLLSIVYMTWGTVLGALVASLTHIEYKVVFG